MVTVPRYLVMTVPERTNWVAELGRAIPGLEMVPDRERNAMETFMRMLLTVGKDPAIILEDDAILTENFCAKAEAVACAHADEMISFFSRKADDLSIGARRLPGGAFCGTVAFYLPPGMAARVWDFYPAWPRRHLGPTATDWLMADYLKANRLGFWQHVPSLAQHRVGKSAIDPRRSAYRQSRSFIP